MRLGTYSIDKVYLGSSEISKIYLGSTSIYESGGGGDQPEGKLYAYTNGNNTIYTSDEVLQGTFKSLNTNDFTNDGVSIDSDGIATFSDDITTPEYHITAKTALFGTGVNYDCKMFINMAQTGYTSWAGVFAFANPYVEKYNFIIGRGNGPAYTNSLRCLIGNGSAWSNEQFISIDTNNNFCTVDLDFNGSIVNINSSKGTSKIFDYNCDFSGAVPDFGSYRFKLDLKNTYFISSGHKTTMAIWDTTSTVYDSSWNELSGAEHYNDVIKVNGIVYSRNPILDIKPVPATLYAYTNGNNTIYAADEVLEGTFKSLNTNSFSNNGVNITTRGIAMFPSGNSHSISTLNTKPFGEGVNTNWKFHLVHALTKFIAWTHRLYFSPQVNYYNFAVTTWSNAAYSGQTNSIRFIYGKGSAWSSESFIDIGDTYKYSMVDIVGGSSNIKLTSSAGSDITINDTVSFAENPLTALGEGYDLNLARTYYENNNVRTTYAIFDTVSGIYNSNKQQLFNAEHYNNVIKVNNIEYTRDSSKDIIVS